MSLIRLARLVVPLCALCLPRIAYADINPCFTDLGLPCLTGTGAAGLEIFARDFILKGAQTAFLALAILFFFYYAIRLILESEEENTISEVKSAYGYGIAGAAIVSLAGFFASSFSDPDVVINPAPIEGGLRLVILFMKLAVSISMTGAIVYLGVRLIMLQGQESEIEEQKKRFFHGLLGVAIILLAESVVFSFMPGAGSVILTAEIIGIINFILTLLGAMAVLAFIIAGIMLVVATDDALKDRAKKSIFTTVITMIVVFSALLIVHFVLYL